MLPNRLPQPGIRASANHYFIPAYVDNPNAPLLHDKWAVYDTYDQRVAAGPFETQREAIERAAELNGAEFYRLQQTTLHRLADASIAPVHHRRQIGVAR